jgi:hypothetical protein
MESCAFSARWRRIEVVFMILRAVGAPLRSKSILFSGQYEVILEKTSEEPCDFSLVGQFRSHS